MRYSFHPVWLTLFHAAVQAQETGAARFADPTKAASATSPAAGMAQSLFGLLLVLAVLFAVAWLVRRYRLVGQSGSGELRVIQGISLGGKERAVLIQAQGRRLLLGVAQGQVALLTELSADAGNSVESNDTPVSKVPDAFKDILKRSLGLQGRD